MKVERILHASVNTAAAFDETAAFYRDVLGLAEDWRPEMPGVPGQWFAVGDAQVHLVGRSASEHALDPSRHHVCFAVDDLEGAVVELEARGLSVLRSSQQHPGGVVHQVFTVDPSGNIVELQQSAG